MNKIIPALALFILLVNTYTIRAQSTTTIEGTVTDSLSRAGLPFANVAAINTESKQTTTQTDAAGHFKLNLLNPGPYLITVSYIGYQTSTSDTIRLSDKNKMKDLHFALIAATRQLGGVTVTASRPPVIFSADKITVNVAGSAIAAGGNAFEAISRAPGVINQGGNLQVRSKPAVVMIDGRYTNLKGEDLANYLSSLPANGIDRIEIINNPSAKYDAQGAALINIISAKNKLLGTKASVTMGAGAGRYAQYQGGATMSYNAKAINIYGSYDYQHAESYNKSDLTRILNSTQIISEEEMATIARNNNALKLGLDYTINKRNSFGILFKGLLNNRDRVVNNQSTSLSAHITDSSSTVGTTGNARIVNPAINFYYKLTLDTAGRTLNVNADYFNYDTRRGNRYITSYFDATGAIKRAPYLLRDNSPGNNVIGAITADYSGRMAGGQLEAGLKNTLTKTDNDILWEQYANGQWLTDLGKTNHFIYKENIAAGYLNYTKSFKKLEIQAGLRAEATHTEGNSETLNQVNVNNYFNLFPSVSLSYQLDAKNQIGVGYRKKIERYSFNVVNPFIVYRSQYAYFQGNPNIKPSFYHTFDASYSYNNELYVSASYSIWKDVLADIFRQDPSSTAAISTFENLNSARSADLTISHTKTFFNNKWTTTNTLGALYAKFNAANAGLNNAGYSAYYSSDQNIQIMPGLSAEVYASYFSSLAFGIYQIKPRFEADAGITKSLFNKAGSITLNVSDIFNTQQNRYNVNSFGVQLNNNNKAESRFIKVVFTYKFGNQNAKGARNRKTGIESEKSRMNDN